MKNGVPFRYRILHKYTRLPQGVSELTVEPSSAGRPTPPEMRLELHGGGAFIRFAVPHRELLSMQDSDDLSDLPPFCSLADCIRDELVEIVSTEDPTKLLLYTPLPAELYTDLHAFVGEQGGAEGLFQSTEHAEQDAVLAKDILCGLQVFDPRHLFMRLFSDVFVHSVKTALQKVPSASEFVAEARQLFTNLIYSDVLCPLFMYLGDLYNGYGFYVLHNIVNDEFDEVSQTNTVTAFYYDSSFTPNVLKAKQVLDAVLVETKPALTMQHEELFYRAMFHMPVDLKGLREQWIEISSQQIVREFLNISDERVAELKREILLMGDKCQRLRLIDEVAELLVQLVSQGMTGDQLFGNNNTVHCSLNDLDTRYRTLFIAMCTTCHDNDSPPINRVFIRRTLEPNLQKTPSAICLDRVGSTPLQDIQSLVSAEGENLCRVRTEGFELDGVWYDFAMAYFERGSDLQFSLDESTILTVPATAHPYLVVHDTSKVRSRNVVIFHEPHWRGREHRALFDGLMELFRANPNLFKPKPRLFKPKPDSKVVFLVEGLPYPQRWKPPANLDVRDITWRLRLLCEALSVNGYQAAVLADPELRVDMLGAEDAELITAGQWAWGNLSDDDTAGWSAWNLITWARNDQLTKSVVKAAESYPLVCLFVGNGHLLDYDISTPTPEVLEALNRLLGNPDAVHKAIAADKRGILSQLDEYGIGYAIISPRLSPFDGLNTILGYNDRYNIEHYKLRMRGIHEVSMERAAGQHLGEYLKNRGFSTNLVYPEPYVMEALRNCPSVESTAATYYRTSLPEQNAQNAAKLFADQPDMKQGEVLSEQYNNGVVTIVSRIGSPAKRKGFEKIIPPAVEVGLEGWERAHSQPAGLGVESPYGIYYAPAELNRSFQLHGIEKFIRHIDEHKRSGTDLILITETRPHPGTLRLQSITYRVDAEERGKRWRLFEVTLEVENKCKSPRIAITGIQIFHDLETIF